MNAMIGSLCAVAVFLPFRLQAENLNLVTAAGFITAKSTVAGANAASDFATAASTAIAVHDYVWELSKEERTKKSTKKKQTKKEIYG